MLSVISTISISRKTYSYHFKTENDLQRLQSFVTRSKQFLVHSPLLLTASSFGNHKDNFTISVSWLSSPCTIITKPVPVGSCILLSISKLHQHHISIYFTQNSCRKFNLVIQAKS
ncbi:hypothetical protein ACOSP7_023061 [Xanthoceras sorbifolium]